MRIFVFVITNYCSGFLYLLPYKLKVKEVVANLTTQVGIFDAIDFLRYIIFHYYSGQQQSAYIM